MRDIFLILILLEMLSKCAENSKIKDISYINNGEWKVYARQRQVGEKGPVMIDLPSSKRACSPTLSDACYIAKPHALST